MSEIDRTLPAGTVFQPQPKFRYPEEIYADRIEELEADNARLREVGAGAWVPAEQFVRLRKALENAAEFIGNLEHSKSGRKAYEKARAALQETSHDCN